MNKQKTNNKMAYVSLNIAIITLNVNGVMYQPKQDWQSILIKHDPTACFL